jgi:hypothetical protein
LLGWVQAIMRRTDGEVVAADDKVLCRFQNQQSWKAPPDLVSVSADANRPMLSQRAVKADSNEITPIPAFWQRRR